MRPEALLLQGFGTFRSMVEPIDFAGVDLFALTGATGSGKTTVLDGICFALYGKVPRLDSRAVEPVISLGATEARIRFDFSIGDRHLTAARVVRRTKAGATTPEARLEERGAGVLASGVDDVNAAAERLLGLSFDHFTKAVLLPQGQFAAFLHDTPARRQDLLRTLLDLGLFERMRALATDRKARAEGQADILARELAGLESIDEDTERAAVKRLDQLVTVRSEVDTLTPELARMSEAVERARARTAKVRSDVQALAAIEVPTDIEVVAGEMDRADEAVDDLAAELLLVSEGVVAAESELARRRPIAEITKLLETWQRRNEMAERVERGREVTDAAILDASGADELLADAQRREQTARAALEAVTRRHAAHALRLGLNVGDPCPVCARPIESDFAEDPPDDLDAARVRADDARRALERATADAARAGSHAESCRRTLDQLQEDLRRFDGELGGAPTEEDLGAELVSVQEISSAVQEKRRRERDVRSALDKARAHRESLTRAEIEARRRFSATRDLVSAMSPPEPGLRSVQEDWLALADWAAACADVLGRELAEAERQTGLSVAELELRRRHLDGLLAAADLPAGGSPLESVITAMVGAEAELSRVVEARRRATELRDQSNSARRDANVAKSLARHLSATGFEAWLMEEALHSLVAGANVLLSDLSAGAYSLHVDKRDFAVIDHRNADETRGIKTLSGGETFLVSLALALALADEIGAMASAEAPRLESIFLDEGFGTLDVESLETVAAVISELGASGRVVGIVTHVKDLAELVPVRYEVTKRAGGSDVRRIDL